MFDANENLVSYPPTTFAIIGAMGFLGQHLAHQLLQEHAENPSLQVHLIDKQTVVDPKKLVYPEDFNDARVKLFTNIDITQPQSFQDLLQGVEVIFHLAASIAYGRRNKASLHQVNVLGVHHVLQAAAAHRVKKLVYVSSFATLGCRDEANTLQTTDESYQNDWSKSAYCYYGRSKYEGETAVLAAKDLDVVIAIPGIMLGPGPGHHASHLPFKLALTKKWSFTFQGGTNIIDVRDVASGLTALAKHGKHQQKYLLTAHNLEHKDLLTRIATLAGRNIKLFQVPKYWQHTIAAVIGLLEWLLPKDTLYSREGVIKTFSYRYFTFKKAEAQVGWAPHYSLDETLTDTSLWLSVKKS